MLNTVNKPIIQAYMQDEENITVDVDKDIEVEQILGVLDLLLTKADSLGYKKEVVLRYLQG